MTIRIRPAADADWAFHADAAAVLEALAARRHGAALREYFGAAVHAELTRLAGVAAKTRVRRGTPRILIVPGIMGTKLAGSAGARRPPRVLWLDPGCIGTGGMQALALPAGRALRPAGIVPLSYARLKLELQIHGFDAEFHAYDWRLGLDESGTALAARIAAETKPVILVGHSMGGLVARMAAAMLPQQRVRSLILLGTPNFGSYAPVMAIRGTYPFVRRLAMLDLAHSPEFLAKNVFATFPGLYQLLPERRSSAEIDLYDAARWPAAGPVPNPELLGKIAAVRARLAPADARMLQIIGVDRQTVVGVSRAGRQFVYTISRNGDGTVPRARALLPGLRTYYVDEWHGQLANNGRVIRAIIELLRRGRTRALPQHWTVRRARRERIDDTSLRAGDGPKIDWRRLDAEQRTATIEELHR